MPSPKPTVERRPVGRPRKDVSSPKSGKAEALCAAAARSPEARRYIRQMLRLKTPKNTQAWRGFNAIPPNSLLETAVVEIQRSTDIPLEIPMLAVLSIVAGRLIRHGCKIDLRGQAVEPTLWSVVLAPSGSGKSLGTNLVLKAANTDDGFPDPASAAKFVESLASKNRSLWVRDEFGQFLKSLEQQTHMTEIKDYMLRLYDNKRIERNTKKEEVCIEEPALVILGMTVYETFASCVGAESLVDGFAQRFSYLIARKDPRRPMERFPLYELGDAQRAIAAKWKEIEQVPLHQTYSVNQECIDVFAAGFKALRPDDERLPDSFFRRIMFAGIRYALVYHVLRRDGSADLTPEDFSWAGRMVAMHITDARELLGTHGLGDLERLMQLAEVVKERCAAQGRACKARDLIRSISAIKTAPQAAGILALLADEGE